MPDGNGEAAVSDLLSFLLSCFIYWGISTAEKFLDVPFESLPLLASQKVL
jgi:hypothetical protein